MPFLAVLLLLLSSQNVCSEDTYVAPVVRVSQSAKRGTVVRVESIFPFSAQRVWNVLTDYDRLHEFIPSMTASAEVSVPQGNVHHIAQKVRKRILFIPITFEVFLKVTEAPLQRIRFELEKGDFKTFEGSWTLEAQDTRHTRVIYEISAQPKVFAPKFIVRKMTVAQAKEGFKAVWTEIQRRYLEKPGGT